MARTRPTMWKVAAAAATALLTSTLLGAAIAPPASADGVVVSGNKTCKDLIPGSTELKIEPPDSGTYSGGGLTVAVTVRNLTADDPAHPGNQAGNEVFDFTASGSVVVVGVAVKGGPDTNFYDYQSTGTAGATGLHAPLNANNGKFPDLSHISFCHVPKAKPKISTKVTAAEVTIGGAVSDMATLTGGNAPTGTITFRLYGPNNATCSGNPVFTSTVAVNGNGTYTSGAFTPTAVGTYRWIASYSGDLRNEPVAGACNDANEQVEVKKAKPKLTTKPDLLPNDAATITGAHAPSGGTLTFKLFFNLDCTGTPAYTESTTVNANTTYVTHNTTVRVTADTSLSWLVEYGGDANNEPATSACTDEQIVIDFK